MKKRLIQIVLVLAACCAHGQGTFIYDQQSATSDTGGQSGAVNFHANETIGQSFIPNLASVGFIRLSLADLGIPPSGLGATLSVNLWAGSIGTGTLLGSTIPVFLPVGFNSYVNFLFASSVAVTPGTTYFFQTVSQTGNDLVNLGITSGYSPGMAFFGGTASSGNDLWFREGVIAMPEPSASLLTMLGIVGIYLIHRKR